MQSDLKIISTAPYACEYYYSETSQIDIEFCQNDLKKGTFRYFLKYVMK